MNADFLDVVRCPRCLGPLDTADDPPALHCRGCASNIPVVGGNVGGIRLQIEDGVSGYLVSSVEDCADRIVELCRDADLRERIGAAGRERVRRRFLTLRQLEDYLRLLSEIA